MNQLKRAKITSLFGWCPNRLLD